MVGIIANDQLCDYVDEVDHEQPIVVVLDKTPFYGEMGGQVGDTGEIVARPRFPLRGHRHAEIDGGFTLHRGHLREGRIELGATVTARVDRQRRQGIRRAHRPRTCSITPCKSTSASTPCSKARRWTTIWLRFDFANPSAVSAEELVRIEDEVNGKILAGEPIGCDELPLAEARKTGAMMLFGEKYPDVVRVVSVGEFSKELCGGTHLANTAPDRASSRSSARRAWRRARGGSLP